MDRAAHQLLRALVGQVRRVPCVIAGRAAFHPGLLGVCPICFEQTGALTDGARMGAAVLAIVVVAILAGVGRFGWRVMRSGAPASQASANGRDAAAAAPPGSAR